MFYNDAIQTVIIMTNVYGKDELERSMTAVMMAMLMIQLVVAARALLFSRLASWLVIKRTVMLTLLIWSGIVIDACFIQSALEFFALGMVVGLAH